MSFDPGTSSPAPRFGRVQTDPPTGPGLQDERTAWQPQQHLVALHRPMLVGQLLDRVMDAVRDPVHRCQVDGRPGLIVLGLAVLLPSSDGLLQGWAWAVQNGRLALQPIPPGNLVVHPCPAGLQWLRNAVQLFGLELVERLRREPGSSFDPQASSPLIGEYLAALQAWLARQLRRHADLRAMRRKVARALSLDPATLALARRIHRNAEHADHTVTDASWNVAVRHRGALEQVRRELPQVLSLYCALLASGELPEHPPIDAISVLRRHLLAAGVWPSTWRLLTRSSSRMLLAVRSFYCGSHGPAMINHLLVLQAFGLAHEPPAEIIDSIWSREGHPDRRWPEYGSQLGGRRAPALGHAIRCYAARRERTAAGDRAQLTTSMHDVIAWIAQSRPRITKSQRRAGWGWMVAQADRWKSVSLAEQAHGSACWPVPEDIVDGPFQLHALGSFAELMAEGLNMHHCVFEHRFECSSGRAIAVSIRRCSDDRRVATALYGLEHAPLNAEWRPTRWKLEQVRTALNGTPAAAATRVAQRALPSLQAWRDRQRAAAQEALLLEESEGQAMEDDDRLDPFDDEDGRECAPGIDPAAAIERAAARARRRPRVRQLVWFSVEMGCTLVADDFAEPSRNADVFFSVCAPKLRSASDVIDLADSVVPVARMLGVLVEDHADELDGYLLDSGLTRRQRKSIVAALDEMYAGSPESALAEWLEHGGEAAVAACRKAVADWLYEPPDYDDWEWFDTTSASAQGAAMSWFTSLDTDELHALGVRIVEGDHPGSTYYGAELRTSIEDANAAARLLGLTCRFR